jgi:hypothetical protein
VAVKDLAKALARRTFDAAPPLYCTTLAAGVRLLRASPMTRPGQINERPYSTLMKFLEMGREKHADRAARKALYEELRQQLVQLRDDASDLESKREMNRLLNRLERDEGELQLLSYPVRGYIEVTNFCNLRCQMCGQAYFDEHGGKRSHLAREAYREIVKTLPYQDENHGHRLRRIAAQPVFLGTDGSVALGRTQEAHLERNPARPRDERPA